MLEPTTRAVEDWEQARNLITKSQLPSSLKVVLIAILATGGVLAEAIYFLVIDVGLDLIPIIGQLDEFGVNTVFMLFNIYLGMKLKTIVDQRRAHRREI